MSVPINIKQKLLLKTNGVCYYCRRRLVLKKKRHSEIVTVDHYIPLSKGGYDDFDNKVPACRKCNNLKADMLPEEFYARYAED